MENNNLRSPLLSSRSEARISGSNYFENVVDNIFDDSYRSDDINAQLHLARRRRRFREMHESCLDVGLFISSLGVIVTFVPIRYLVLINTEKDN
jgi:hypothetical protein